MLNEKQIYQVEKTSFIVIFVFFIIFIYVFQYPLSLVLNLTNTNNSFTLTTWLLGYNFVILSSLLFIISLYFGLLKAPALISHIPKYSDFFRRPNLKIVISIFAFFFIWSYLMMTLKIGITIYTDFEPLPFKLTGFLFYGRLLIQPMILAYIAYQYKDSNHKIIIFILIITMSFFASLTSGSRFIAILFSLPLLFLFTDSKKYFLLFIIILLSMTIATYSRYFYLPELLGGNYMRIYANETDQAYIMQNLIKIPFEYIVMRSMGMKEVLMLINYDFQVPHFFDSLELLYSAFLPLSSDTKTLNVKSIYQIPDSEFGGVSLDMFSNYFITFGANIITYIIGLSLVGWMVGRTYVNYSILLKLYNVSFLQEYLLILLILLIFDIRISVLVYLFLGGLFLNLPSVQNLIFRILNVVLRKNTMKKT